MTTPKDIHPIVMKVLDELSEKYFIHKRPTINFTFITERPTRSQIEKDIKGILEDLL
jgi:hypothetical protein